ncbi:MAG: hypothetical protein EON95_11520 [Caulobacteraceae bacterium]|nr:MAG: hypothetical protein EON95_11520 [Caulobacteraceae bacterium]
MRFRDLHFDRENRVSLGVEIATGQPFLSIPVANGRVDYEEYYRIDQALLDGYPANKAEILILANRCRRRENDAALIIPPGSDRGVG